MSVDVNTLPEDDPFRCLKSAMGKLASTQATLTRGKLYDLATKVRLLRDDCMAEVDRMGKSKDL